ncbi:MAG: hypothetical protein HC845_01895 [Akkermansiaceae bacterium]|nr:hypothetical protein [Akkermansiaceae bacterium]
MKTLPIFVAFSLILASQVIGKTVPNNAAADLVLGQLNFTTPTIVLPTATSVGDTYGVTVDPVTRKVFVASFRDTRVLRYASADALSNGAPAEMVFGQAGFTSNAEDNPNASRGMRGPGGIFLDRKGRLWVADFGANRVVMFESASLRTATAPGIPPFPNLVLGQPDFVTFTGDATREKMDGPDGVWVDAEDRLWVADSNNNRVLRFDAVSSKGSGDPADGVLGQTNFTTASSGSTQAKFNFPTTIAVSTNGTLFVVDPDNNRVLRFNAAATKPNGANADAVLGQPDFTTTTALNPPTASSLNSPWGATITPDDRLWVSDRFNHRMLRYENAPSKASGAAADGFVGQPDFITKTSGITDRKLNFPGVSPHVDATGSLWVPDVDNNRVLRFPADTTLPTVATTGKLPKKTSKKKVTINGTASDANGIASVQFRVGNKPLQSATGTTTWQITAPLKKGKNTITIIATDSVGNAKELLLKVRRE